MSRAKTYVINAEPDGTNINTSAGSTHIEGLQKFVVEKGLEVGFDYDGDAILYIYGRYMKERGKLITNTVVTTVMSNFGLYKAFDEVELVMPRRLLEINMFTSICRKMTVGWEESSLVILFFQSMLQPVTESLPV